MALVAGMDNEGWALPVTAGASRCSGAPGVGLVSHRFKKFFILSIDMVYDVICNTKFFKKRVPGSGYRVQGAGCRVQGAGFRVPGLEFRKSEQVIGNPET
jgi:hypothetical protein